MTSITEQIKNLSLYRLRLSECNFMQSKREMNMWADAYNASCDIVQSDVEKKRYLFSPGGAATEAIKKHYKKYIDDYEFCWTPIGLNYGHGQHVNNPENLINNNFSAVYVASHPIDAILSFYMRNFFRTCEHSINVGGNSAAALDFAIKIANSDNLKSYITDPSKENIEYFFKLYLEYGVDFFNLESHMRNWFYDDRVLVIKYHNFTRDEEKLRDCFCVPSNFPKMLWKNRTDKKQWLSNETLSDLEKMYAGAIELYETNG